MPVCKGLSTFIFVINKVQFIFHRFMSGDSLGKIFEVLARGGIVSPPAELHGAVKRYQTLKSQYTPELEQLTFLVDSSINEPSEFETCCPAMRQLGVRWSSLYSGTSSLKICGMPSRS